jgi:predicted dehydrogenase
VLTAVCDADPQRLKTFDKHPQVKQFTDSDALLASGEVDAVLIATPHYYHTTIGIAAFRAGVHVLSEKPISVHKADAERLIAAHDAAKGLVFAAMFNQRTQARYKKVKQLITTGELGEITRVNWIITTWFRTEAYYASGGWRATWRGEGGGVLLNQCPHQLDLLTWFFGMPSMVCGFCSFGKRRNIEVEDEVTAYMEYPNGATGVFVTSVTEAPGTNRLEICGEMGKLVVEGPTLQFTRNEIPMSKFARETDQRFATPPVWNCAIPVEESGGQHAAITQNFVDAILDGAPLAAPGREGIHSVELGNAMLYSGLTGRQARLPLDGAQFERRLKKLIRESRFNKDTGRAVNKKEGMERSF